MIHTGSAAIDPARLAAVAAGESEAFAASHPASRAAHDAASVSMAGGVPMPWMARFPTPFPIFCDRAEGSHVVDVDGHDYVDFCLGDSAAMTGHAPPAVVAAVGEQAARGFTSLLPDRNTAAVGAVLARRFGLPLWQLCLSATDANRFVIRLAREITGRPKVLVFDHCYHGTVDEALVTLDGTGVVARADLIGPGADPAITTVVVPFNDLDALREALATGEVACVLTEPALTNVGIVPPAPGFLDGLRAATSETGTLLVIDETHTMCMGPGGYTARQQGLIASPAAIAAGDLATTPVGTGGWILDTEATVANSVYVFHANPDYWNADAQGVETVEIHYIPDPQARTNALLSGDVDYAVIDAQFGAQVEGEGFAMNNTPAFPYYLEVLDREGTMVPELADQRVRQAMTYAIDQETFYEVTNAGAGTPSNQWTIPGQFGFNDDFTDFGFDLDKAKALMEEAGVDGFDLTIPSYGPFDVYNEAIVGFLAEIGINVSLEAAPTGNLSGAAASGQYAAAIVPAHEVHPNDFYRSRVAVTATQNPFQVASPEIDELMGTITGIDADDEATYEQMSAMVATDASIISLGTINCMSGWDGDRVSGVQPWIWTCGNVRLQGLHVTED